VNLVICLLSTQRFLTAVQIARIVPGYEHDEADAGEHAAFQRMFERDKAELRELGVPLETGTSSVFDTEPGYRIARRDYALPEIRLAPDEAAAVGLAARLWRTAGLASAAASGLLKLRAAGIEVQEDSTLGIEPAVGGEPALDPLLAAVRERRPVRFRYRAQRDDHPVERHVQPWGVVSWRGRWYLVGHDTDRAATRCFRLSRMSGQVAATGPAGTVSPPEVDLLAEVARNGQPEPPREVATLRVRPGAAAGLRRLAEPIAQAAEPIPGGPAVDRNGGHHAGWDSVRLAYGDHESFAARLTGYGSAVVVLDPPELRDAVIRRLRDLVAANGRSEVPVLAVAPGRGAG
jgi:proteasome accessory factor B